MANLCVQLLRRRVFGVLLALFVPCSFAADLSVPVNSGWNLLGNTGTTAIDAGSVPALFDGTRVTSLWKWNSQTSSWAFHAPSLAAAGSLATYASGKGYQVLSSIAAGEGFWVNASQAFTLSRTGIASFSLGTGNLVKGWNLVATGDALSPAQLDSKLGGTAAAPSFSTMWAWDAPSSTWYFSAPSLIASGGLASYIQSKGYLDFGPLVTGGGLGFWLNSNVTGATTATGTAATDALFQLPADPANVNVTLDSTAGVTQLVTATTGGSLSATDARGNAYTLSIPSNALKEDTWITMTPIAGMAGIAYASGVVAGVQLAPEGLQLRSDALLTIVPAAPVPVASQTFFGYSGTGSDLHIASPGADYSQIQVLVPHFSGWGLLFMSADERRTAITLKRAADHEVRLRQEVGKVLGGKRTQALIGVSDPDAPDDATVSNYLASYYGLVVRPRVLVASTSCENAVLALNTLQGNERTRALLGTGSHPNYDADFAAVSKAFTDLARPCAFIGAATITDNKNLTVTTKVWWKATETNGNVVTYKPTGGYSRAAYRVPAGCNDPPGNLVSPPIDPNSGYLIVDYGATPPAWRGMGVNITGWFVTLTCPKNKPPVTYIPGLGQYLGFSAEATGQLNPAVEGAETVGNATVNWSYRSCNPSDPYSCTMF